MNTFPFLSLIFCGFSLLVNLCFSQTVNSEFLTGTSGTDRSVSYFEMEDDSYWLTFISDESDLPSAQVTSNGFGETDIVVQRIESGTVSFEEVYGSTNFDGNGIPFYNNGFLYLAYSTMGQASGNQTVSTFGGQDVVISKINPTNGDIMWQKVFGGTGSDRPEDLLVVNNKIYVATSSLSDVSGNKTAAGKGGFDVWLICLDTDGNELWQKTYGGGSIDVTPRLVHDENHLYLGCSSSSGVEGDKTSANFGLEDLWVLKLNMLGDILAQESFGGDAQDLLTGMSINENGQIYFSMSSNSDVSGNKTTSNFGNYDTWILSMDSNLDVLFESNLGGSLNDANARISCDHFGRLLLVINSGSPISGNKTVAASGTVDNWYVGIDESGNVMQQLNFGGSGEDVVQAVGIRPNGEARVITLSDSPVSGDKTLPANTPGEDDVWVYSFTHLLSLNEPEEENELVLYPTINNGDLFIKGLSKNAAIHVVDMSGRWIDNQRINNALKGEAVKLHFDITDGVYFLLVRDENKNQFTSFRFIVRRD